MVTQTNIQTMTGAKAVIATLKSLGVDTVFGYPGGIVLDLYDELYRQSDIKHILVRHEQSAVHAAEGYARVTGKCGVVFVTSGPGATNTVSGIVNAYLDGYPLIVITGQVTKNLIGKNAFQEANICDITKSCTKKVFQVTDGKDLTNVICEAFKIATNGKKGPVLIDIAKNVLSQTVYYQENLCFNQSFDNTYSQEDINRIHSKILNSKKPVIVIGGGVNHSMAYDELHKFISGYELPFVSTMMGLGAFYPEDIHYIGMIGIFGDNSANELIRQSDLIISLGARFNDRITCMFKDLDLSSKLVSLNIAQDDISKCIDSADYLVGDIKNILEDLNKIASGYKDGIHNDWVEYSRNLKSLNKHHKKVSNMLHSFEVLQSIQDYTNEMDLTFSSEVGQHQIYSVQNIKLNPKRKMLLSGGFGTMGFGLPAAIGACTANAQKTVVCIAGDGSIQMSLGELSVCRDYDLNLKIFIINNGYLGMVRQLQQNNYGERYSQTKIFNPDFVELAKSFGIEALRVNSKEEIYPALEKAFSTNKTFIVDFMVEPMEVI